MIIKYPELDDLFDNNMAQEIKKDKKLFPRIKSFAFQYLNLFENVYIQLLSRESHEEQKQAWIKFILEKFESILFKEIWTENKNLFDKSFVDYINNLIEVQRQITAQ